MRLCSPAAPALCAVLLAFQPALASSAVAQATSAPPRSSRAASLSSPAIKQMGKQIDDIVNQAVQEHRLPGAVVLVGHHDRTVFERAYGQRALVPAPEAMTENTIFDMASLTKTLVTATAVMQLFEQGRLRIDDTVATYLPDFAAHGKGDITIRELLTHYSGLASDLDLTEPWQGKQEAYRRAMDAVPVNAAGVEFRYSDINFITLGAIVEKISGMPLEAYEARNIAAPLGLRNTGFLPPHSEESLIAPTQWDENHHMLRGVVHDPTSRRMGGVAGHAGLFSTASDVSVFARNLLDRLAGRPSRFPLKQSTLRLMTTPGSPATGTALRGLGWDIESPYSSNRGELFPVGSFGHTGFTGTSLWMDPVSDTWVVILANAVHPDGGGSTVSLRTKIATVAAAGVGVLPDNGKLSAQVTGYNESLTAMRRWPARNGQVKTGIDVLEADHFAQLAALAKAHGGKLRLGLLTNQTGLDADGHRTVDVLAHDAAAAVPGLALTTLFSPEHGINGVLDKEGIANTTDQATGLPVISLYGTAVERRPSPDVLKQLDAVVIDLQDAGVRFYTYEAVVRYFLEAAAKTGTAVIVLDRPNPVGGSFVQGPLSDPGSDSYVNVAAIPARHGMTLGELARFLNGELELHAPLSVVAMEGWQRGDWFDSTGLTWTNPSPNLRSLSEETLYPGLGLIEQTNISVGRGTEMPFEVVGAPWIDARALAHDLNRHDIPGVRFVPVNFTPEKPYPYAGQLCHGVNVVVTGRNQLDAPKLGLEVASSLHRLYPEQYHLDLMAHLLCSQSVLDQLRDGKTPQRIEETWSDALATYMERRAKYLLY